MVLTSNRTRELHDALKRRCLYHWVGYPSAEREVEIVLVRAPGVSETLTRKVVAAVNRLRALDLAKPPGVAETIDWVRTLEVLGETDLDARTVEDTLGAVVKERDDLELVRANLEGIATRCLRRRRSSACWSRSPINCAARAWPSAPAMCSPTARPWRRSIRPIWSICTGPGAPRWSSAATRFRSTTGCSEGSSSTRATRFPSRCKVIIRAAARDAVRAAGASDRARHRRAATSTRPGSAWSPRMRMCSETRPSRRVLPRSWPRCGGSWRACGSTRHGDGPVGCLPPVWAAFRIRVAPCGRRCACTASRRSCSGASADNGRGR